MIYEVDIAGKVHKLELLREGSEWRCKLNGSEVAVDAVPTRENVLSLLIGGKSDQELCRRIATGIGPAALNLSGDLTLRQTVEALRRCALVVTNDSAPTHLGVAAGIRVLTLFGSTVPEYGFAPFGPRGRTLGIEIYCRPCTDHGRQDCPQRHFRCLREITPDRVLAEIRQMLDNH